MCMLDLMSIISAESAPRPDFDSPVALKSLLGAEGLAMTKRFGQNFLTDRKAREKLVAAVEAEPGSLVWEIGPGIGAMTAMLLDSGVRVDAFEIDHGFARVLSGVFGGEPGFSLVEGDFLRTWPERAASMPSGAEGAKPDRIFGNLPYNVASAIVASLLEGDMVPERIVFTVQKEAALRMAAGPGTKDYSAFSVLCTSACKVKILFDLGAYSFWPRPRVTSSAVLMTPRKNPVAPDDRRAFSRFVRSAFSSRRKTFKNNLGAWTPPEGIDRTDLPGILEATLSDMGKAPDTCAEALTPEELHTVFAALAAKP